jgi:hypothetical protein
MPSQKIMYINGFLGDVDTTPIILNTNGDFFFWKGTTSGATSTEKVFLHDVHL